MALGAEGRGGERAGDWPARPYALRPREVQSSTGPSWARKSSQVAVEAAS